jgi:magnesium transporter
MASVTSDLTPEGAAAASDAPLQTAAAHATDRVPTAVREQTAGEVRAALVGRAFGCADDIAVLDGRRLVGLVAIEALLAAEDATPIHSIMDAQPPAVAPGVDQEVAAWQMVERGESSLAVVDAEGRFLGLIPPARMLGVALAEHDEDLARLGGYLKGTRRARETAEERVHLRLWHRLPWLLLGLLGAMASAVIVGAFEEQLERQVLLAIFVPGVVYMADAVGTQTEALIIRGLSVGVSVRRVVARELATGLVIGLVVSGAFLPLALVVWGEPAVALAVALALLASCSIATVVAMALPWAFHRLGYDPAFGSGPLATVIQDLLSIVVYFAIATPLAT